MVLCNLSNHGAFLLQIVSCETVEENYLDIFSNFISLKKNSQKIITFKRIYQPD